jgi:hypothetical protein
MSYTKGKWRQGLEERAVVCETDGKIVTICSTDIGNFISQDEAKANAKLIAAAPKLLEALQIIERQSGIIWDSKSGKDFEVGCMLHIINEAIKSAQS